MPPKSGCSRWWWYATCRHLLCWDCCWRLERAATVWQVRSACRRLWRPAAACVGLGVTLVVAVCSGRLLSIA